MNQKDEFQPVIGSLWMGLGEVQAANRECPGVWYASVKPDPASAACEEYYAVSAGAGTISKEAKKYGQPSPDGPEVLLYPLYGEDGGWKIIQYEVQKYQTVNRIPLPEGVTLLETAWEGMEAHPAYFGSYPVPAATPWGRTMRHRAISNGIYWLETERCGQAAAIHRGVRDELSGTALALSVQTDREPPDTWGYFFFTKEASCIPIFELMPLHPEWEENGLIDRAALMNAVCTFYPRYAIAHNLREQAGQSGLMGLLSGEFGIFHEPTPSAQNLAALSSGAGIEFYTFLKE